MSPERGRGEQLDLQHQDRSGRNFRQGRIGRDFPSRQPLGARFGGDQRAVARRGHGSRDDSHAHKHKGHCGGGYWHTYYRPYFGPFFYYDVFVPAPIFITTPFFCGLCGIGFAGHTFFHHHLHFVHALAFEDIESSLIAVDGRLVFAGY